MHSLNLMVDELSRQVKRHRDKLRHRREAHQSAPKQAAVPGTSTAVPADALGADG